MITNYGGIFLNDLTPALMKIERFQEPSELKKYISNIEKSLESLEIHGIRDSLRFSNFNDDDIRAAFEIKKATSQIDVIIHAWGILSSLPYILEPDEKIQSLSLGAGNTGKNFDLQTDRRVAEFKFIQWRGGPEAIRQNGLFKDFYNLVKNADDSRERYLYVLDKTIPLKFLEGNRDIESVLSRNVKLKDEFKEDYGRRYQVVSEYYNDFKHLVKIVDLKEAIPKIFDKL